MTPRNVVGVMGAVSTKWNGRVAEEGATPHHRAAFPRDAFTTMASFGIAPKAAPSSMPPCRQTAPATRSHRHYLHVVLSTRSQQSDDGSPCHMMNTNQVVKVV